MKERTFNVLTKEALIATPMRQIDWYSVGDGEHSSTAAHPSLEVK